VATHASALKAHRQSLKNREHNRQFRSRLRGALKTVRTAIDEGFKHAMPAIIDSNVSTILTGAVLYQYGTGAVHGVARLKSSRSQTLALG